MTSSEDIRRELAGTADPAELDGLVRLAERLEDTRPTPSAAFRGDLRRRLLARAPMAGRPARLRLLVAAYGGSGVALLMVAAVGLAGAGPFAS
jgi:hypothetical protein